MEQSATIHYLLTKTELVEAPGDSLLRSVFDADNIRAAVAGIGSGAGRCLACVEKAGCFVPLSGTGRGIPVAHCALKRAD